MSPLLYRKSVIMRGSRNFRQGGGGPGQSDKKKFLTVFFSPQPILQKSNGQFQRNLISFEGSNGGPTFSREGGGGSNCLFPIETHKTCDFPGGSGPPVPPLWIRTWLFSFKHTRFLLLVFEARGNR